MALRIRLSLPRVPGLTACLCASAFLPALASPLQASTECVHEVAARHTNHSVAELTGLPDASAAEAWLGKAIQPGDTLADHPDFFAAASEVFFDADENLLVFVYRSAHSDRWIAWVSFEAERMVVVHTAATAR
jgi:hypothetical protein